MAWALTTGDADKRPRSLDQLAESALRQGVLSTELPRDHARCGLETLLRREIENVLAVFIEDFKWYAKDDDSSWRSLVRMAAGSALAELGRYDEAQTTLREARDIASTGSATRCSSVQR